MSNGRLSRSERRLYRQACTAGYDAAKSWLRTNPSVGKEELERWAAKDGSAMELTTHPWWGDRSLFGTELTRALEWYDLSFRATLDMAVDRTAGDEED